MTTLVAILGAGAARRFGGDKLVQPCAGKPLGSWALEAALATGRPVVWVAAADPPAFARDRCAVVRNLAAEQGQAGSVACAAEFAERGGHGAVLVMLADMPLVGPSLLLRLLERGPPAACRHPDGRPGVPALFPRSTFQRMRQLAGDRGAGPLLAALPELALVECDSDTLLDVDEPRDLARAARILKGDSE